jgi:hypothetical protein
MSHAHFLLSFVLVVKNSQKLYRFFTDFFTRRGEGGWIWLDWVGLGRTSKTSRTLLCQKHFGGQAGWSVRQPPSSKALWRSGKRCGGQADKKVGRIWSDMLGYSRIHETTAEQVLRSIK